MTRISVLVKAALDLNLLRTAPGGGVVVEETPLLVSEYDRNAVQTAIELRDRLGGRVSVLSVLTWGPVSRKKDEFEKVIREVLAMGADEAYAVVDDQAVSKTPAYTARVLAGLIKKLGGFDVCVAGEGSSDMVSSQMASRISALLGVPAVTFVKRIEVVDGGLKLLRDLEDHTEEVLAKPPLVVSVTGEASQPRLPTLLQIRRAFTKPIKYFSVRDVLGDEAVGEYGRQTEVRVTTQARKRVIIEEDVEKAVETLVKNLVKEGVLRGVG